MCMPRSFTRFAMITRCPFAFKICDTDQPRKFVLMCPKCSGLFVFGDEYSIMMVLPVGFASRPIRSFPATEFSISIQ